MFDSVRENGKKTFPRVKAQERKTVGDTAQCIFAQKFGLNGKAQSQLTAMFTNRNRNLGSGIFGDDNDERTPTTDFCCRKLKVDDDKH